MLQSIKRIFKFDFVRYGIVGATSTVLDYLIFNLSYVLMGNHSNLLWLATAIGFACGTVNGYLLNSRWTFSFDTRGKETKKFIQFIIVSAIGLIFTEIIVLGLATTFSLDRNIAKAFAIVVVFFWNYFANKYWTFRK